MTPKMVRPTPPITPVKRKRSSSSDSNFGHEGAKATPSTDSPTKRARSSPKTPSKSALKKIEAANKKQWKADWQEWVQQSVWENDDSNPYQRKIPSHEIHRSDGE